MAECTIVWRLLFVCLLLAYVGRLLLRLLVAVKVRQDCQTVTVVLFAVMLPLLQCKHDLSQWFAGLLLAYFIGCRD